VGLRYATTAISGTLLSRLLLLLLLMLLKKEDHMSCYRQMLTELGSGDGAQLLAVQSHNNPRIVSIQDERRTIISISY